MAIQLIFFFLSFFVFFIFIIYFFCNCLSKICSCLCCCCDDDESLKEKPGDSDSTKRKKAQKRAKRNKTIKKMASDKFKKTIVGCSLILVLALSVLGILWTVFMFKAVSGVNRTDCSMSNTFENIKEGVKNDDVTFGGFSGINYLLTNIKTAIDGIAEADMNTLKS